MRNSRLVGRLAAVLCAVVLGGPQAAGQAKKAPEFPPRLPDGKEVVADSSADFLKAPATRGDTQESDNQGRGPIDPRPWRHRWPNRRRLA